MTHSAFTPELEYLLDQIKPLDSIKEIKARAKGRFSEEFKRHISVILVDNLLQVVDEPVLGLCFMNNMTYIWTGKYWQSIKRRVFKLFLGEVAYRMGLPKLVARQNKFHDMLYSQFSAIAYIEKDCHFGVTRINLMNGVYEFTNTSIGLRKHLKDYYHTYVLPFVYNENASCKQFIKYLDKVVPDKHLQMIIAEYLASCLTRHLKLEKAIIAYGTGANGKSVLIDIIVALFGVQNVSQLSAHDLSDIHNRVLLIDKLLNCSSESKFTKNDKELLKKLISGEEVLCCVKFRDPFTTSDYAKMWFNCNELPHDIVEQNEAFSRRFIIVPFNVTILAAERNPNLAKEIIATELSGIFNWVLEGLNRLIETRGFTRSTLAEQMMQTLKEESDSVFLFLQDKGCRKSDKLIVTKIIFFDYRVYCKENGYPPTNHKDFNKRLVYHGFKIKRLKPGMVVNLEYTN